MQKVVDIKSFHVAGVQFRPTEVIEPLKTGEKIRLVAEPDNKYDPSAIKVECLFEFEDESVDADFGDEHIRTEWKHIGYIPKKDTAIFHLLRKAGIPILCQLFVNQDAADWDKLLVTTGFTTEDEDQPFK